MTVNKTKSKDNIIYIDMNIIRKTKSNEENNNKETYKFPSE